MATCAAYGQMRGIRSTHWTLALIGTSGRDCKMNDLWLLRALCTFLVETLTSKTLESTEPTNSTAFAKVNQSMCSQARSMSCDIQQRTTGGLLTVMAGLSRACPAAYGSGY